MILWIGDHGNIIIIDSDLDEWPNPESLTGYGSSVIKHEEGFKMENDIEKSADESKMDQ